MEVRELFIFENDQVRAETDEVSIVGDDDHGRWLSVLPQRGEIPLKPDNAQHVEEVCGFVENQYIGIL